MSFRVEVKVLLLSVKTHCFHVPRLSVVELLKVLAPASLCQQPFLSLFLLLFNICSRAPQLLKAYPDIIASFLSTLIHFFKGSQTEARSLSPLFFPLLSFDQCIIE